MGCSLSNPQINMETLSGYTDCIMDEDDLRICRGSWEAILMNRTPAYLEVKQNSDFPHKTCSDWLTSQLYEELFTCCPHARILFSNKSKGGNRKLISMISKCIFMLDIVAKSHAGPTSPTFMRQSPCSMSPCSMSPCSQSPCSQSPSLSPSPTARCRSRSNSGGNPPDPRVLDSNGPQTFQHSNFEERTFPQLSSGSLSFGSSKSDMGTACTEEMSIAATDNIDKFSHAMRCIATTHYSLGVRSADFCLFGGALLAALRVVCGDEMYTEEVAGAWRRLYAVMLRAILVALPTSTISEGEERDFSDMEKNPHIRPRSHTF